MLFCIPVPWLWLKLSGFGLIHIMSSLLTTICYFSYWRSFFLSHVFSSNCFILVSVIVNPGSILGTQMQGKNKPWTKHQSKAIPYISLSHTLSSFLPTHIDSFSPTLTHSHTLLLILFLTYTFCHAVSLSLSLAHTLTHTLALSRTHSLSLMHTQTHTLSHTIYPLHQRLKKANNMLICNTNQIN